MLTPSRRQDTFAALSRRAAGVCAAVVLACSAAAGGGEGLSAVATLTLADAVPLDCAAEPLHLGPHSWVTAGPIRGTDSHNPYRDLAVELTCRDGRWDDQAWARTPCIPGVEQSARLVEASVSETEARFVVAVEFRHPLAEHYGGSGRYVVRLIRRRSSLEGSYEGKTRPESQAAALRERSRRSRSRRRRLWAAMLEPSDRLAGRAYGRLSPPPRCVEGHVACAPGEHPRLLLRKADLPALRAKAAAPTGKLLVAALHRHLPAPRDDAAAVDDLHGYRSAGWALLWRLTGQRACAASAALEAQSALAAPATAPLRARARQLAGLALAYDLCGDGLAEPLRRTVAGHLRRTAGQFAALDPLPGDVGLPEGPWDYRFATIRAAAGLAALAVRGDLPGDAPAARANERTIAAVDRWARRFLAAGIGRRGGGTGNAGYDEAVEIVLPFLQASRLAAGRDLAAGTGAEWLGVWGMVTGGAAFNRVGGAARGGWLALGLDAMPARFRPAARWQIDRCGIDVDNPLVGLVAVVNYPHEVAGAEPGKVLPDTLLDTHLGGYVFRGGWQRPRDFVTTVSLACEPRPAAGAAGSFAVFGLGREWIARPRLADGLFTWPRRGDENVVRISRAPRSGEKPLVPIAGSALAQVRANRPGVGCISLEQRHFAERPAGGGAAPPRALRRDDVVDLHVRRVIGIDYSGASGAEGMFVFVDSVHGAGRREKAWEIDVGHLPADRVTIADNTFVVRPPGTDATMTGTVVFPESPLLNYRPPHAGRGGRIQAWMSRPKLTHDQMLHDSLQPRRDLDAPLVGNGQGAGRLKPAPQAGKEAEVRRRREAAAVCRKLYEATSSIKQGAGDRRARARSSFVVVLTIQRGEAPAVAVPGGPDEPLLTVGKQKVYYRENYVLFERSR